MSNSGAAGCPHLCRRCYPHKVLSVKTEELAKRCAVKGKKVKVNIAQVTRT